MSANTEMLEVSKEMVRLYKEQFGRGPTNARSLWSGENVITVILENTLTAAERNLVKMGEHKRLRDTRTLFQYAAVKEFCDPVERITGRLVRGFVSGIDAEVDGLSTEIFVLYPKGEKGVRRQDLDGLQPAA